MRSVQNEPATIWYLTEEDTRWACGQIDPVKIVREVLVLHARNQTLLPTAACLTWTGPSAGTMQSVSGPGFVGGRYEMAGAGIVNGGLDGRDPQAAGLVMLFDRQTARIRCVMAAAHVVAVRTAGLAVACAQALLCQPVITVGVMGAGELAVTHIELLARALSGVTSIAVHDPDAGRAKDMRERLSDLLWQRGVRLSLTDSAREAVLGADLVISALRGGSGAIEHAWLSPGAVVVDVSLDGVLPDVVLGADTLIVDEWARAAAGQGHLLGRMNRAGQVRGPRGAPGGAMGGPRVPSEAGGRRVDAELGEVLAGLHPGRCHPEDVILVCPYGPAVLDIALATEVYRIAMREQRGIPLPT